MEEVKVFSYNGSPVSFNHGERMVNATEMAKPFGENKRAKNWLALKSSQEFIQVLSEGRNLPSNHLVRIVHGDGGGTWMHEDVALEFARWLSPAFGIWCNDRIKELLTIGITATPQTIDSIISNPDNGIRLLMALKEERLKRMELQEDNDKQRLLIQAQQPQVTFANAVVGSKGDITIRELAKLLKSNGVEIGQNRLYMWMVANKYVMPYNNYEPYQKYMEQKLFVRVEHVVDINGTLTNKFTTKITPKGQQYFINKFLGNVQSQSDTSIG